MREHRSRLTVQNAVDGFFNSRLQRRESSTIPEAEAVRKLMSSLETFAGSLTQLSGCRNSAKNEI